MTSSSFRPGGSSVGYAATQRRRRRDCGSATIYVVIAAVVLCAAGLAAVEFGGLAVAQHRAAAAADLAALAGAQATADGRPACAAASDIAARNGAVLIECAVRGREVTVRARTSSARVLGKVWTFTATARAGPATQ